MNYKFAPAIIPINCWRRFAIGAKEKLAKENLETVVYLMFLIKILNDNDFN
jgi:hypothetical protein